MGEITGFFGYKGITILQHKNISIKLKELFSRTKPSQILEIGTSYGGLTLLIRDILDDLLLVDTKIKSYDVYSFERGELDVSINNGSNVELINKNIFNSKYDKILDDEIITQYEFIQQPGVTIVMCDGGYKINEFNLLSEFLKPGDIIMAHDYSKNVEYFEKHIQHKIWDWHEIHDSDIKDAVIKYNLHPYMDEDFQSVVWVCKIKK